MARAIARAVHLLVVALLLPLSACLDDGPALTKEEAPLGPNSLAVPAARDGDESLTKAESWGHYRTFEDVDRGEPKMTVEPYRIESLLAQGVVKVPKALDRFARPFEGVEYASLIEIQAVEGFEMGGRPVFGERRVFEQATGLSQYYDTQSSITVPSGNEVRDENSRQRYYEKEGVKVGFAQLAGHVLVLGKTISFNETHDGWFKAKYRTWVNLTPVRATYEDGVRLFEVRPSYGLEVLEAPQYPPELLEEDEPSPTPSTSAIPTKTLPPRPTPRASIWYSAQCPYPVKWDMRTPFSFEFAWYWNNDAGKVLRCDLGTGALTWNAGEPLPQLERMPGATFTKAESLVSQASGTTFPSAGAWKNLQDDPALTTFQNHKRSYPDSYPMVSTYFPDPSNQSYTWDFRMSQGGSRSMFSSRLTDLPGPVDLYQNSDAENYGFGFPSQALTPERLKELEVVHVRDALKLGQTFAPGPEPALRVRLATDWSGDELLTADILPRHTLRFGPTSSVLGQPIPSTASTWRPTTSINVDLSDGGLLGLNLTWDFTQSRNRWPWTTLPRPQTAAAADVAGPAWIAPPMVPSWAAGGIFAAFAEQSFTPTARV